MSSVTSLGSLSIRILLNAKDAESALTNLKKASAAALAVGTARTFSKGLESAVSNALDLNKQLALLNTISPQAFDTKGLRAFSDQIALSATDTASALYQALSSGQDTMAASEATVRAAADLAKTTGTDLATATRTIAGLLNASSDASYTAADAAAGVFEGFKTGVGSADDYATALGKLLPTTTQLGISTAEMEAEVAASTQTLKSAPAAATGLSQAFQELAKTNTGAGKLFKDTFGHSFQEDLKKTHSGIDSIGKLLNTFGTDKVLELFHAKGSGSAIEQLILAYPQLQKALAAQTGAQDDFKKAVDGVNASAAQQWQSLKVQGTNALGTFGDSLLPVAKELFPLLEQDLKNITPTLVSFGNNLASVAGFLTEHAHAIKVVAELIGIRLIPLFAELGGKVLIRVGTGLSNSALAFIGFQTKATTAMTTVVLAQEELEVSSAVLATKFETNLAAMTLAAEGFSAKTIASFRGVGKSEDTLAAKSGVLSLETKATLGSVGASAAGMASRVAGAAGTVGIVLSLAGLAWDNFGLKSLTGAGFFKSAVGGIKYDSADLGSKVLGTLGNITSGFGLFDNSVSDSLHHTADAMGNFADGVISGFRQVDADIYDSAGNIIQNLSAIQQQALITMGALTANSDVQKTLASGGRLVQRGPGIQVESASQVAADQAAAQAKSFSDALAKSNPFKTTGLDPTGGGSTGTSKADKQKQAISKLGDEIAQLAHVSELSKDQIDSLFKTIEQDTKDAGGSKGLLALEKKWNKSLDKMADRLVILKDKVSTELDFGKQVKQTVLDLGSVADATEGIGQTFFGVQNHLRSAVAQSQQFYAVFKQLEALGLNDTSLSQLATAGPASLANAQAILSGGAAGVGQINAQEKLLDTAGDKIANKTADNYYKAGQSVSQGFLAGIQSQEKELENTMDKLGKTAGKALKKSLGINSPSRVMMGLGNYTAQGFADGIISGNRKVANASASMGGSVVFGAGSVVVQHAPGDPMQAGTITGRGIASVLERQKAQRALGGVG